MKRRLQWEVKASGDVKMSATCNSAPQPLASTALLSEECKSANQIYDKSDVRQEWCVINMNGIRWIIITFLLGMGSNSSFYSCLEHSWRISAEDSAYLYLLLFRGPDRTWDLEVLTIAIEFPSPSSRTTRSVLQGVGWVWIEIGIDCRGQSGHH